MIPTISADVWSSFIVEERLVDLEDETRKIWITVSALHDLIKTFQEKLSKLEKRTIFLNRN